jgi:hypothetical protein
MSRNKRKQTPEYQWESALISAYYDYRWKWVLDPLYQKFQQWKAGELSHLDIDEAIHRTYKPRRDVNSFFSLKRDYLVRAIQINEEWFLPWVKDNPPPAGYKLG